MYVYVLIILSRNYLFEGRTMNTYRPIVEQHGMSEKIE